MATPAGRCHWTNETKDNIEKEEQTSTAFARIRCQSHTASPAKISAGTAPTLRGIDAPRNDSTPETIWSK
ncbi:hypothetical protein TWF225_004504 [Orbilia oligospora]|nr:hypothetical protein TWF225_004504 [Orbilia oligospora]KAF3244878.1 hypothetical protein TWF128_009594 [Orbilia oligospora]KAF3250154.1 hypothetical protein TWF217_008631 [Orbilia oligospora]KAF3292898.1 hypothetical protein TWF132_005254 [Orbilia oligospora]